MRHLVLASIILGFLTPTVTLAQQYRCIVEYAVPGGASTWQTRAKGEQDAIYKWKKTIQRGDERKRVTNVICD